MNILEVSIGSGYPYVLGYGCLRNKRNIKKLMMLGQVGVCIVDETVNQLHGEYLKKHLGSWLKDVITIPPGEQSKSRDMKSYIESQLFAKHYKRDVCLVAFGGGVILDLVGFVAATYLRGVNVAYLPTTLLAMVDACIGGKVAINTSFGKNTLGVIRQPHLVIADFKILKTLPRKEWVDAMAEVVKHAVICDHYFFQWLAEHRCALLDRDELELLEMLRRSAAIKIQHVRHDVDGHEKRHCLNFGHTFAHALEVGAKFSISHGCAVAHGIFMANLMSVHLGYMSKKDAKLVAQLLEAFGLLNVLPGGLILDEQHYWQIIVNDKKSTLSESKWVLLDQIGQVVSDQDNYLVTVSHSDWQVAWKKWFLKYCISDGSSSMSKFSELEAENG